LSAQTQSSLDPAESPAPNGTVYRIPSEPQSRAAFREIAAAAEAQRRRGGDVIVVQGLGFFGAAVAAAVASASDEAGRPLHYVVAVDLSIRESYWKVGKSTRASHRSAPPMRSCPRSCVRRFSSEGTSRRQRARRRTPWAT
jgi:hypothetical protein